MRLGGSENKTRPGKGEDIPFTFRQGGKVGLCKLHSGDNGVVVAYLAAVKRPGNVRGKLRALHKGEFPGQHGNSLCRRVLHIVRKKCAVCPGIGKQPFFIQGLRKVKGLLRRVAVDFIGFPL